ncbi:OmpA family protein [Rhodovibrio salinarum]|uniref:OmpA family protein n=1 Tax=Rhodovibrio salinarum TaxID=1087 RepID=A0A934UYT9_9PROT|nr:OmpA family protein [Rhodovibrio salinarum]MBK1696372.1 OmpA family protein [Rhodovibrio salinarum]
MEMRHVRVGLALFAVTVVLAGCGVHEGMKADGSGVAPEWTQVGDDDGDGVLNPRDACPGTPEGVRVDAVGCALDSDNDGVRDTRDDCPDTPEGAEVNDRGCPLDTDGDGVANARDACAHTPPGVRVDAQGCSLEQGLNDLPPVFFNTNKASIRPESYRILRDVADRLAERPGVRVRVIGHTDNRNTAAYNMDLSQRRAKAVVSFLIERGIDPDRLVAVGRGESEPIASNDTEAGMARNRRVEYEVIGR